MPLRSGYFHGNMGQSVALPTYREAEPAIIEAALKRSQRRPSGNWYVFAASASVRSDRPFGTSVAGADIVAWRDTDGGLHVGPAVCPHLGADLTTGTIDCGALICPWHGLRLSGHREFGWQPLPGHDDGVLAWVRLDRVGGEEPLDGTGDPGAATGFALDAVTRPGRHLRAGGLIANRLDPWHGAWFTRIRSPSSRSSARRREPRWTKDRLPGRGHVQGRPRSACR